MICCLVRLCRKTEKVSEKAGEKAGEEEAGLSQYSAALRIQKLWRGHLTRKQVQRRREEELIFIGMVSCV